MADKLQIWSYWATIAAAVAAFVAAVAAIFTLIQFDQNLDFEKDKLAVEIFSGYAKQQQEFRNKKRPTPADTEAFAVSIQHAGESIYRFRTGDPGWEESARGMIRDNREVLLAISDWNCKAIHHGYYCEMQRELGNKLKCKEPVAACPEPKKR